MLFFRFEGEYNLILIGEISAWFVLFCTDRKVRKDPHKRRLDASSYVSSPAKEAPPLLKPRNAKFYKTASYTQNLKLYKTARFGGFQRGDSFVSFCGREPLGVFLKVAECNFLSFSVRTEMNKTPPNNKKARKVS